MAIDKKSDKTISNKKIKRKAKKLNIVDYMIFSIDAIQRMQATLWRDYKKVKPTAKQRRAIFLEKKAQNYEHKDEEGLTNKMREMNKAEALKDVKQEVKFNLKEQGSSNILHIEMQDPKSPSKVKEIHD